MFYLVLIIFLIVCLPVFLFPHKTATRVLKLWAGTSLFLLRIIAGIKIEVRGLEHLPAGPVLIAAKHQSLWETFALLPLVDDPAVVLKKELTYIPFFGWYALKFKNIKVDRSAGSTALRKLIAQTREAKEQGRQIIIFPEGTRKAPDAEPDYKPGVAAIYKSADIICVPVALNSGLYWPRRQLIRNPGTIVIEFLPALPTGLARKGFMQQLETSIENATAQLVAEGRKNDFS